MNLAEYPEFLFALIGLLGIAAQWFSWWLKLPAILFLLLIGIVAGPVTGLIRPNELLGELLFPLVSLGVAVILFEGSLTLRFSQIKGLQNAVRNLVTVGALINWLTIGVATRYLLDLSWDLALLFGALVTVTGPTVIVPMLRTVRPNDKIASVLRWEGIIVDPIGALLAVLVFGFIVSGQEEQAILVFTETILVGGLIGVMGAYILATILRRRLMPDYLHNVATLVLVLGIFSGANILEHESGLLAVTVMGIMLANMKGFSIQDILDFKENLSVLFISGLFIVLAARMELAQFEELGRNALYLLAFIIFLARPLAVFTTTLFADLNWREQLMIAWIGPRGIVAAAIAPLFVLKLEPLGYAQSHLLVPLTFMVIVGTVVLQSITARPLANLLRVSEPIPHGVLIVGADRVARAIARALVEQGYRAKVADTHWVNIRTARLEGLETYFGDVTSAHADRHLDLVGMGRLLAMSQQPTLNALACLRYKAEFGSDAVFSLQTPEETEGSQKQTPIVQYRYSRLFGESITHTSLATLLNEGAEIRATLLTEEFDFAAYQRRYDNEVIPLFAIDPRERLHIFTADNQLVPQAGWKVIGLLPAKFVKELRDDKQRAVQDRSTTITGTHV